MEEETEEEDDLSTAETGMNATKAEYERSERKTLLEAFILLLGNIPGEK